MLSIHRIPLTELINNNALPLTRGSVIDIAGRIAETSASEIRIVVTTDLGDGEPDTEIELATIELNSTPDGKWWLQYVSHPVQSSGLTAAMIPSESDFFTFTRVRETMTAPALQTPLCADELEEEDLGPLATLNLRLDNATPLVPSKAHLSQLNALLKRAALL